MIIRNALMTVYIHLYTHQVSLGSQQQTDDPSSLLVLVDSSHPAGN